MTRSASNALALKSIWLDIDVKDPPKGYATKDEARHALDAFVKAAGLPAPSAIIGSGGGLHVYWISSNPLTVDEWKPYAEGLKTAAIQHGLRCDAGLTTDCARILRVPGTYNYKTDPPRRVEILYLAQEDYDFSVALAGLALIGATFTARSNSKTTPEFDLNAFAGKKPAAAFAGLDPDDDHLSDGLEYDDKPLDPRPLIKGCPFFKEAFETNGRDHSQPLWNLSILATTFLEKGDVLAHEIGNAHPGYTRESTDAMYQRKLKERKEKGIGWPSCKAIEGEGCKLCASCPHYGKIKSPLNLVTEATKQTKNKEKESSGRETGNKWPDGVNKSSGIPLRGYANTLAAFRELGIKFTYDEFRQKEFTHGHRIKMLNGELSDRAITMVRDEIRSKCDFYPSKDTARDAITAECLRNRVNPVTDYFGGLTWDGTPRISKLLHRYLGAEDTPLNAAISTKLMCAIVRRSKQPGCKFDHQVVLQGDQGVRKSTFCEDFAVFSDLYTDAGNHAANIKEQMEVSIGKQIIEYPEHAGFSQKTREHNKAALSRKIDRARLAYAHYAVDAPRSWVPIATTNPGGYLNDPTGERRYWHVAVVKYDREAFLADKDQLYAEAVVRESSENLWLDTPELVKAHDAIVATVKEPNTLVDDLADLRGEEFETARAKIDGGWVSHREERVSNKDVRAKLGVFGVDVVRLNNLGKRISDAVMMLGWTKAPGTLVCRHGAGAEGGYRRPLPDIYVADQAQQADDGSAPTVDEPEALLTGGDELMR